MERARLPSSEAHPIVRKQFPGIKRKPFPISTTSIARKALPTTTTTTITRKPLPASASAYVPEYQGVFEGFTLNYLKKMFWRVKFVYEFEDLLQDAYEVFMRCKIKYTSPESDPRVTEARHFMSLYQVSLRNHIFNLSRSVSNERFYRVEPTHAKWSENGETDDVMELLKQYVGDGGAEGELRVMIHNAPPLVKELLDVVVNKKEMLDREWEKHRRLGGKADMGNIFLCKVMGYNPLNVNVVKAVRNYFGAE